MAPGALIQRCFVAEPLLCLAANPAGTVVVGGGGSGTIYMWIVASGRLVGTVKAHTRGVTRLRFSDGSGAEVFSCLLYTSPSPRD